jgi:D-serine deaminase-like pyridoxal phosphate-dependent protein
MTTYINDSASEYRIDEADRLLSPSLVIDRAIVRLNFAKTVEIARGVDRLRPHIKTHKAPAVVRLQSLEFGISKFKCATIAEAEMIARVAVEIGRPLDVLLAYPLVGPNVARFVRLIELYPSTTFRAVVADRKSAQALSAATIDAALNRSIPTLVDLDVGMGRTGIAPGDEAFDLYTLVARSRGLSADGLHAYDGHVHDFDIDDRRRSADRGFAEVDSLRTRLLNQGLTVPRVVIGGTPTFPIHAERELPGLECSPGTCVFHDAGYATRFPDLPFRVGAFVLTRVVSKPRRGRICLDVGYKAVAADPPNPRVELIGVPDAKIVSQSEEHLVVDTELSDTLEPGDALLAIPKHICPTCALYQWAYVMENHVIVDRWEIVARDRSIGV